ncbi:MAG: iron-containing redox enzyme family protein [Bacteriovorax sp.]|nr:iron-containing redox enzyme family protein [Bacteriovorax sp.]
MQGLEKVLAIELDLSIKHVNECDWKNKEFYADYVAQTFYYVRHSTRLLALCASRLNYEQEQQLHLRFIKHLGEESNHEKLALNDLKHLGYSIDDFKEHNTTRIFYEPQYYKIEHEKPLALMGYVLYLEALAKYVCPPLTQIITELHGNRTASFLQVHGEEDPAHVEQALKMIMSLDDANLAIIEKNIIQSSYAYNQMISELKIKWNNAHYKKSA